MAGKPKLHYYNGRGRMESIRWLLATAGVEFEEQFVESKQELQKLKDGGFLLFQQVPMVEIDGMKLVQSRAILNYIAKKSKPQHGQDFLVGKQLSKADVLLLETILMVEELKADILSKFPTLKVNCKTIGHGQGRYNSHSARCARVVSKLFRFAVTVVTHPEIFGYRIG
uniref:glutathione transferase n=1 Tax=Salvator merianae TaxID=96440 RepID=A0A8D0B0M4_SALMN